MGMVNMGPVVNMQATATIAKELLKSGNSPTAEAMVKQNLPSGPQGPPQVTKLSAEYDKFSQWLQPA